MPLKTRYRTQEIGRMFNKKTVLVLQILVPFYERFNGDINEVQPSLRDSLIWVDATVEDITGGASSAT